jgi:hypothetical protein
MTVPVVNPEAPEVIVIHGTSAEAVQAHSVPEVVTLMANDPPSTGADWAVGATMKAQAPGGGAGMPAWVTTTCVLP